MERKSREHLGDRLGEPIPDQRSSTSITWFLGRDISALPNASQSTPATTTLLREQKHGGCWVLPVGLGQKTAAILHGSRQVRKRRRNNMALKKRKTQQLHWPMNHILLLNRICTSNLCVTGVQSHKLQAGFNGLG